MHPYILGLIVAIFVAFSIGLNLGLHGVLSLGELNVPLQAMKNDLTVKSTASVIPVALSETSNALKETSHSPISFKPDGSTVLVGLVASPPVKEVKPISPRHFLHDATTTASYQRELSDASKSIKRGPITSFVENGGLLPIVLLTCNRPQLLEQTIQSLLAVRGVIPDNVIVSQDGAMKEIAMIVKKNGFQHVQNVESIHLRGGVAPDGSQTIARHYKFSLSAAFALAPLAPAIIVVEDDLLFSPDFYEYFHAVGAVLERDNSLFLVSAWSDNGFRGKVVDTHALRRTEYFPGLGWLLPRELYMKELEQQWPLQHWDHWLRSAHTHKGREIVFPQVWCVYVYVHVDVHC